MNNDRYGDIPEPETDISFVSSRRSSTDRLFPLYNNNNNHFLDSNPRLSYSSDIDGNNYSFESVPFGRRSMDICSDFSSFSQDSDGFSSASQGMVRHATNVHLFHHRPNNFMTQINLVSLNYYIKQS